MIFERFGMVENSSAGGLDRGGGVITVSILPYNLIYPFRLR